jgi:DNA-binding transcriptional MerR regulator
LFQKESKTARETVGESPLKKNSVNNKLYYSISEVANITDTKAYVLRFWEKEFPTLRPRKNRGGNRIYQQREIDLINRIRTLLYEEGYTIEGARQRLKNQKVSESRAESAKSDGSLRAKIREIKKDLKELRKLFS